MASVLNILRTCGLIICVIFQACAVDGKVSEPWIVSVKIESKSCEVNNCKYLLRVHGGEFLGHYSWRLTPEAAARGGNCNVISPDYELREVETDQWESQIEVLIPHEVGKIFFCLRYSENENAPFGGSWVHQGPEVFLDPRNDVVSEIHGRRAKSKTPETAKRKESYTQTDLADLSHDIDVNNLPQAVRPNRNSEDVEILIKDKYIPLNELNKYVPTEENRVKYVLETANDVASNNVASSSHLIENLDGDVFETWNANFLDRKRRDTYSDADVKSHRSVSDGESVADVRTTKSANDNLSNADFRTSRSVILDFKSTRSVNNNNNISNVDLKANRSAGNKTDDLITKQDIIEAKKEIENAIKVEKTDEDHEDALIKTRRERQVTPDFPNYNAEPFLVKIEGLRVEHSEKEPKVIEDSIPSVLAGSGVTLRLFGEGFTTRTVIAFTYDRQKYGEPCKYLLKGEYMVKPESLTSKTAVFEVVAPAPMLGSKFYICAKNLKVGVTDPFMDEEKYMHQGTEPFKILATHNKLLPLWVTLILVLVCLMFSALFSGLNLGLMSLDRTELKIISNTGTEQERKYARAIMPVRDHGNYLLCSILLGNVAVNSTFTILLDELTSGLFAVIFSTLAIVLLGEITPQAICSRHGLMVGAKSIMVTKAVMAITAPLAFPVSKLLDYFLGEEIGSVYNRERLKELVKVTTDVNDLDKDEVNIISGALELRKKTVSSVMTKLEDVFMLPISSVLDFETMSEIVKSGYSRIPVYEGSRGNIVTVLFIKDLAFVDPDDNTPLRTLCQYYQNPCNFVFEDVTLDVMFRQFKDGHKGHMAFVHRINNEGEGDPFYETIGLVTLEDVIEEMIQAEIVDETDVFMDNRTKRRRNRPSNKLQDFTAFAERHENQRIHISPQLTLATFQFLSTSVDAFRPDTVSETVLRRLLRQDVIQHIKLKGKSKKDPSTYVFHQGKPVDYFVLILEGRVEVTVGRENLVFEAGPFTYFGVQALSQNVGVAESPTPSAMGSLQNINMDSMLRHTFVPDYSVRAVTELFYLTVKRSLYLAAKRATLMEKGALSKGATNEQFDTEVDKHLCNSSSANIPISMISKKLLGKSTSTASTRDDLGSTSTGYKLSPRVNVMELVCAPAPQSERGSSWPEARADRHIETAKWAHLQDPARPQMNWPQDHSKSVAKRSEKPDIDANTCSECLRNNFWINKSVLNKSVDDVKGNDTDHSYKKKKTTFHTDTSLLTFHPVSPPTRDEDRDTTPTRPFKHKLDPKNSNSEAKTSLSSKSSKAFSRFLGADAKNSQSDTKFPPNRDITFYEARCSTVDLKHSKSSAKNILNVKNTYEYRNSFSERENPNVEYKSPSFELKCSSSFSKNAALDRKSPSLEHARPNFDHKNPNSDHKNPAYSKSATSCERQCFSECYHDDPQSSIDDREYEKDLIDYSLDWREDRIDLEKRRIEMEERVLTQLSKIIKILEKKDQT